MRSKYFSTIIYFTTFLLFISCFSKKEIANSTDESENTQISKEKVEAEISAIYRNNVYKSNIKTVLLHKKDDPLSIPIVNLNNNVGKLKLSFDDLDSDIKDYYYSITHCNSDWRTSDLMKSEYLNGFSQKPITNFEFSFNTLESYTHYSLIFPEEDMTPTISGNYILKIFKEDTLIITERFMLLDNKLNIETDVRRATLAADRKNKHEVDFKIYHPKVNISDPYTDLTIHVKQNNRDDNAIVDLKPLFVKNQELIYDYEDVNTFWGNNEFRHFDIKSFRYQSQRIKDIITNNNNTDVYLFSDFKRSFDLYSIIPDINGNFLIESQEGWNSSVEADYANVHFSLPFDKPINYGELYIIGELSDWQLKNEFKLHFNAENKKYECTTKLKQGYYNYHYILYDTISNKVDVNYIEGTHYQTRNDYYIYVYYRETSDRYDQLIGFIKTSSKNLF